MVHAAPITSTTCEIDYRSAGPLYGNVGGSYNTTLGFRETTGASSTLVAYGGEGPAATAPVSEQLFLPGICKQQMEKDNATTVDYRGFFANADNPSECLTATGLDHYRSNFKFTPCQYNGTENVISTQSFAWVQEADQPYATVFFVGEFPEFVNSTSGSRYNLHAQNDYGTNLVSSYSFDRVVSGPSYGNLRFSFQDNTETN